MTIDEFLGRFGHIPTSPAAVLAKDGHIPHPSSAKTTLNGNEKIRDETNYFTVAQKHWVINLARAANTRNGLSADHAITLLNKELSSAEIAETAESQLHRLYDSLHNKLFETPPDAVEKIYNFALRFENKFGRDSIPRPPWCARQYNKLWLSAIILGLEGRQFLFARPAFEKVSGFNRGCIQNFINSGKIHNFIEERVKGMAGGKSTVFRLCKEEDMHAWQEIQPLCGSDKPVRFKEMVEQEFPWLFVCGYFTETMISHRDCPDIEKVARQIIGLN